MTRPLGNKFPEATYHVMAQGNQRQRIIAVPKYYIGVIALVLCSLLFGCSRSVDQSSRQVQSRMMSGLTEELLSASLIPGTARAEIIAKFGEPASHENIEEGVLDDYRYEPATSESWESKLSGFQVLYRDNKVVKWAPTYSTRSVTVPVAPDPATVKAAGLSFRVVGEPEGALDSDRPDIVVHTIKSVALSQNTTGKQSVVLELCDEDNLRMMTLTKNAVGKSLIFSVGNEPVETWLIMGPVQNNRYEIGNLVQERVGSFATLLRGFVGTCPQTNATPIPPRYH